jgi:LacI family transcriptional regulator
MTRHQISDPVVARVLAAAESLAYQPDALASSLRSGRSRMVGVVLPDITNPVFPPILGGIEAVLDEDGYVAITANAASEPRRRLVVERLMARQVDGLILATVARHDPLVKLILDRRIPLVLVNRSEHDGAVAAVTNNEARGMALAVEHLVSLGHRNLAHLGGPLALSTGYERREGFLAAAASCGLDAPAVVVASAYSRAAGREAAEQLLAAYPGITGIVAANDLLAIGCLDALRAHGLACPADVSLIGHNDMPLMDALSPALTTIRIQHREMGQEAARLLLRAMTGQASGLRVMLQPDLIVRDSTRPPPTAPSARP